MGKIICFIAFCTIFLLGSCTSSKSCSLDFMTVFNVYKWTGSDHYEDRYAKIMEFLDNYDSDETYTGIDSVKTGIDSGLYRYVAKCSGLKFEHLNFKPLSDKHCGIAYYGQIETPDDADASIYDCIKIYFQDTLAARSFVDDAIKYGFKRINSKEWASYQKEYPSKDPIEDSIMVVSLQYSACYFEEEYVATYSVGVLSHKDKHVVTLSWCP